MAKNDRHQEVRAAQLDTVRDYGGVGAAAATVATAYVEQFDASWLDGITIERIVPLQEGQGVRGIFLGRGPSVEVADPVTGEVRELGTWRIEVSPGVVIRLLDSARLRSDLAALAPQVKVRIMRLGSVDTKRGRRVTDYIVGVER